MTARNLIAATLLAAFLAGPGGFPRRACAFIDATISMKVEQISSSGQMQKALESLLETCNSARKADRFSFDLQERVLKHAGECISRINELEAVARRGSQAEQAGRLFRLNRDVIDAVLSWNMALVEDIQENRLDRMENPDAFFASPQWQKPHYLISLADYWLSWNSYYACLLIPDGDPARKESLDKAIEGFSRALIDFREDEIITKGLLGRALCYTETKKFDRALQDIDAVVSKTAPGSALHTRCGYERARICYLRGQYEAAIRQAENALLESSGTSAAHRMAVELKKLRINSLLKLLEKSTRPPRTDYIDILRTMREVADDDETQEGQLYRFVQKYIQQTKDLPASDLGPIGSLALADWHFDRQQYAAAAATYRTVVAARRLRPERLEQAFLRLGFSLCHLEWWQEALDVFDDFFGSFSESALAGKAACLQYVAAANHYRNTATRSAYGRYIKAVKSYLTMCPDTTDKSEAHYQLGSYYRDRGQQQKAVREFSSVQDDSPHYRAALHAVLTSELAALESADKAGKRTSESAGKVYRQAFAHMQSYRRQPLDEGHPERRQELQAQLDLMEAKLYTYGPDDTCRQALNILEGIEGRFPKSMQAPPMRIAALRLRIQCYQRLQMPGDIRRDIAALLDRQEMTQLRWNFLLETASECCSEAAGLRSSGRSAAASVYAQTAIMIYEYLAPLAATLKPFEQYADMIRLRLALLYRDENSLDRAKVLFTQILKHDPKSADALYNLARISQQQGRWEDALAAWRAFATGLEPGTPNWLEARYGTASALARLGRTDDACEILGMTEVLHPRLGGAALKEKFALLRAETCESR